MADHARTEARGATLRRRSRPATTRRASADARSARKPSGARRCTVPPRRVEGSTADRLTRLSISAAPVRPTANHPRRGADVVDPQIDTITLGGTDLSRAAQFYEDGFGFPVRQTAGDCLTLGLGGSSSLELCPWDELARDAGVSPETSGFRGFTLSYIVEQAADVDATLTRLVHFGGEISKTPKFAFWGYSGHVTDPSGHLWKIASPKRRPLLGAKRAANGLVDRSSRRSSRSPSESTTCSGPSSSTRTAS